MPTIHPTPPQVATCMDDILTEHQGQPASAPTSPASPSSPSPSSRSSPTSPTSLASLPSSPASPPPAAAPPRAAVFYSISSTQPGLRGIELGHFLIKRVAESLLVGPCVTVR